MKKLILLWLICACVVSLSVCFTGCEESKEPEEPRVTYAPPTEEPTVKGVSLEFVSATVDVDEQMGSIKVKWINDSDSEILIGTEGVLNRYNNGLYRALGVVNTRGEEIKLDAGASIEVEYFIECRGTEISTTYMLKATYTMPAASTATDFYATVSFEK